MCDRDYLVIEPNFFSSCTQRLHFPASPTVRYGHVTELGPTVVS